MNYLFSFGQNAPYGDVCCMEMLKVYLNIRNIQPMSAC
jgi:hypothetical protein